MYPYNYIRGCQPNIRNNKPVNPDEDRSLLLPLLFGAAVGFPLGFIASNNKNQGYLYFEIAFSLCLLYNQNILLHFDWRNSP